MSHKTTSNLTKLEGSLPCFHEAGIGSYPANPVHSYGRARANEEYARGPVCHSRQAADRVPVPATAGICVWRQRVVCLSVHLQVLSSDSASHSDEYEESCLHLQGKEPVSRPWLNTYRTTRRHIAKKPWAALVCKST